MSSIPTNQIWMLIFSISLAVVVSLISGISTSFSQSITSPPSSCDLLCANMIGYYLGLVGNVFVIIGTGALNAWTFFPFPFNMLLFAAIVVPIAIFLIQIVKGFV
jgi:hypothetical protein